MSTPFRGIDTYLTRAFSLSGTSEAETLYDEWASAYDTDLIGVGYASPRRAVEAVIDNLLPTALSSRDKLAILDAGCGTGLVGTCLSASSLGGKFELDGVDLSAGMLEVARGKGVYRYLDTADLNKGIEKEDGSYDVVVCVGTLTKGHVGAEVLGEFARLTGKSGLIVATVHDEIWESGGFDNIIDSLKQRRLVEIVSLDRFGIVEGETKGGRMVVLRTI
ncbi:S-adenosyl-L-methionine-dependent methyltransferase [Aspergillus crustosus]